MANPNDKTAQLAQDTQPLPPEKLTEEEWILLGRIADEFALVQKEVAAEADAEKRERRNKGATSPWHKPEPRRSNRVMMLDGPRGSGKSSLILTLIRAWQGDLEVPNGGETARKVAEDLARQGKAVRVLPSLDFDPQPQHLHPYAWLVAALEPVVCYLEANRHPKRSRSQGLCEEDDDLRTAWSRVYRQALVAWDGPAFQNLAQADLDQLVFDQSEGQRGWVTLQEKWTAFLDRLLTELEDAQELPSKGLIVYHIDDIDLQPGKVKDVLLAVRLARHPRVVFVLGGHMVHLREVLARELADAKAFAEVVNPKAEALAADILKKVIPERNRFAMPMLGFMEAVRQLAGAQGVESWLEGEEDSAGELPRINKALLAAIRGDSNVPTRADEVELREGPDQDDEADDAGAGEGLLFRDFQQIVDSESRGGVRLPSVVASDVLRRVRGHDGLLLIRVDRSTGHHRPAPAGAAQIVLNARWAGGHGMAETQEFQYFATYKRDPAQKDDQTNPSDPLPVRLGALSELWLDSTDIPFTIDYGPSLPVAGNNVLLGRRSIRFWWPGIQIERPMEARQVLKWWRECRWRRASPRLRAAAWLDLSARTQKWPDDIGSSSTPEVGSPGAEQLAWRNALNMLPTLPTDTRTERGLWPYRTVAAAALLAAPEFGLPEECQRDLLERARDCAGSVWPTMCDDLDRERRAGIQHAVETGWDAFRGAAFDADSLEKDIAAVWPNAPWFRKKDLAPLGTDWLKWELDGRQSSLEVINRPMPVRAGGYWAASPLFYRNGSRGWELTWPVNEIGEQFAKPSVSADGIHSRGDLRAWRVLLSDVLNRLQGVASQVVFAELWRRTTELRQERTARDWFRLDASGMWLSYHGPALVIRRQRTSDEALWSTWTADNKQIDPVVSALLLIYQSVVATVSCEPVRIILVESGLEEIYSGTWKYPESKIAAWFDHHIAVERWKAVTSSGNVVLETDPDLREAVDRWRAACWLAISLDAGRMARDQQTWKAPFDFGAGPHINFPPIPDCLREWASWVDVAGKLDSHVAVAWEKAKESAGIPKLKGSGANLRGIAFTSEEASEALRLVQDSNHEALKVHLHNQWAADAIEKKRPTRAIEEMAKDYDVGPKTAERLRKWARESLSGKAIP